MKKIRAYWKNKNPFIPDINQLIYTKTIEVPDDIDMEQLKIFAIEDSKQGYIFDKFEVIDK